MNIGNLNELKRDDKLIIRKLGDSYYLIIGESAYEANEIGATIVNATGKDLSVDDLVVKISEKYSFGDMNQIREDVVKYIEFLVSEGILISCE